jgi:hypothetical protein
MGNVVQKVVTNTANNDLERSRETPLLALAGFELPPKGRRLVPMNHCAT